MAPVKLKYIVSFTSQDDNHKANNLITGDGIKKWLCHSKDRSGKIEIIIQLEQPTQFSYIDIGTLWCASLEVRVGNSDWPQTAEYKTLVPMVNLMSPIDCHLGRKTTSTQMFTTNDYSISVANQRWDRIQLICNQPYRKDMQLGISFIRIRNSGQASVTSPNASESKEIIQKSPRGRILDIKKHFFGDASEKNRSEADNLKQKLLQISSSSDNGCDNLHQDALSRTAQLVLKASEKTSSDKSNAHAHYNTIMSNQCSKRGLFSDTKTNKSGMTIEEDMAAFLPTLNLSLADIDTLTVADLRHKFERKRKRKLSIAEKRKFCEQCQSFLWNLNEQSSENQNVSTNGKLPSPSTSTGGKLVTHCGDTSNNTEVHNDTNKKASANPAFCSPSSVKTVSKSNTNKQPKNIKLSPAAIMRKRNAALQSDSTSANQINDENSIKDSKAKSKSNKRKRKETNSSSESVNDEDSNSDICYNSSSEDSDDNNIDIDDSSPSKKTNIKRKLQTLEDVTKSYQDLYKTFSPSETDVNDSCSDYSSVTAKKLNPNSKKLIKMFDSELSDDDIVENKTKNTSTPSSKTSNWLTAAKNKCNITTTPSSTAKSNSKSNNYKIFRWSSSKSPASQNKAGANSALVQQLLDNQTSKNSTNRKSSTGTGSCSMLCKACGFLIPQDTYAAHCSTCISAKRTNDKGKTGITTVSSSRKGGSERKTTVDLTTPSSGNQVVDLTQPDFPQCPICLQQFPQEVLMVHASECGL